MRKKVPSTRFNLIKIRTYCIKLFQFHVNVNGIKRIEIASRENGIA